MRELRIYFCMHAGLTCTMPGYQRRALAWMMRREALQDRGEPSSSTAGGTSATAGGLGPSLPVWNGTHHPCWQRVALPSGEAFYHNWNTGALFYSASLTAAGMVSLACLSAAMLSVKKPPSLSAIGDACSSASALYAPAVCTQK